ncbi:SIS domain-containing protein [Aquabacterium sp.]|uniref:SIS domain-containing protein n=1 Tax=Aquabacterium sp. TaxID=1872578 RepID=UPI002E356186|nr:SIS domain-containing protein [Aquabacterium sp.]HEX5312034.1 SIS domain-containing protein [Aquabacterium sp.]
MSEASFQPYLQQPFLEMADLLYQSSDRLAQQLNFAAQAIVHTVTTGGKVICAGDAEAGWLAQQAAGVLVRGRGRERPPLSALALSNPTHELQPTLAQQVQALGHPGDVWLVFSLETDSPDLVAATEVARDLDLILVAFTGEAAAVVGPLLRDTDVWVPVPGTQTAQLFAMAWMGLHGLCAAVDTYLLGEQGS